MPKTLWKISVYSVPEVANICGVVNQMVTGWIENGQLKAFSTPGGQYRVHEEDLIDFLLKHDAYGSIAAFCQESGTALVIDHDHESGSQLKAWLEDSSDYKILWARDGFEAGWLLRHCKPALIFLNVDLPGVNIDDMVRKIKEDPALGNPRLVALVSGDAGGAVSIPWADACLPRRPDRDTIRNIILSPDLRAPVGSGRGSRSS
ncbi:MAG: helix-turn-helix domain-containing protein [Treponema sp.]|jgi:excisionase family DNA binding protein|nr:helix-turn-helix domain-containing protein [Treponema sp.]